MKKNLLRLFFVVTMAHFFVTPVFSEETQTEVASTVFSTIWNGIKTGINFPGRKTVYFFEEIMKNNVDSTVIGEYKIHNWLKKAWVQGVISAVTYYALISFFMHKYKQYKQKKAEKPRDDKIKSAVEQLIFLKELMEKLKNLENEKHNANKKINAVENKK